MGRSRDDFIRRTGGLMPGETPDQFNARIAEIEALETRIRKGPWQPEGVERLQRRLCELKGISWEFDDGEDD